MHWTRRLLSGYQQGLWAVVVSIGLLVLLLVALPLSTWGAETDLKDKPAEEAVEPLAWHTLSLMKAGSSDPVEAGALLTYTIAYKVDGNEAAPKVIITDVVPVNTSFFTATGGLTVTHPGVGSSGVVTWELDDRTPSPGDPDTGAVTLTVLVDAALFGPWVLTNAAWISDTGDQRVSATVTTTVEGPPELEVAKAVTPTTAQPGGELTYTISYTVTGSKQAPGLVVTDAVPVNTKFYTATGGKNMIDQEVGDRHVVTWTLGLLDPNPGSPETGTVTMTVEVAVPSFSPPVVTNTAWFSDPVGQRVSDTVTIKVGGAPELEVTKPVTPATVQPGGEATYTILLSNLGDQDAWRVRVTDLLPKGFGFGGIVDGRNPVQITPTLIWEFRRVDEKAAKEMVFTATAGSEEGEYSNRVTATLGWESPVEVAWTGPAAQVTVKDANPPLVKYKTYLPLVLKNFPEPPPTPTPPPPSAWHQGQGLPEGVTVYNVATCASNCNLLYAGTRDHGVYQSDDGGESWQARGLAGARVYGLAVDATGSCSIAYAATKEHGVQKTEDGGANWSPANNGLGDRSFTAITLDPQNNQILYVGTDGVGVYKSTNAGGWWAAVNTGLPANALVDALVVDPNNSLTVYAGTWGHGVYKSTNGGGSWSAFNNGLESDPFVYSLAIDPSNTQILYAGTYQHGVYQRQNSSWTQEGLYSRVAYAVAVDDQGDAYAGTDGTADKKAVWQRSKTGSWAAMDDADQLGNLKIRSLTFCDSVLQAGTTDGAWWYGPD